jgi:phosphoglycolate phosphatase
MKLVLFDVDGTLLLTGGAGMRAFSTALKQVFGLSTDFKTIRPDGKTDPLIARELLAHFGQEKRWTEQSQEELFSTYIRNLRIEMDKARNNGSIHVLPGVRELLEALEAQADFAIGLVTGNLEEGARIKIEMAGLARYFHFGGYGSDSEEHTARHPVCSSGTRGVGLCGRRHPPRHHSWSPRGCTRHCGGQRRILPRRTRALQT